MYKKLISFFLILISILFLLKTYYDKKYERSFKVSDTTSINKVFISDMKGNQIKLEKNESSISTDIRLFCILGSSTDGNGKRKTILLSGEAIYC